MSDDAKRYRKMRVTITETFTVDEFAVRAKLGEPPADVEPGDWLIEQFELHTGSQYGDELFSSWADVDHGVEITGPLTARELEDA